jgi:dolichol-phosphate mannosyltransferase
MSTDPAKRPPELLPSPTGPLAVPAAAATAGAPPLLSIIIPTFNESKNIGAMLEQLTPVLHSAVGESYEIIVVDDDSPDRTWEVAQAQGLRLHNVKVMRRRGERGRSSAAGRRPMAQCWA